MKQIDNKSFDEVKYEDIVLKLKDQIKLWPVIFHNGRWYRRFIVLKNSKGVDRPERGYFIEYEVMRDEFFTTFFVDNMLILETEEELSDIVNTLIKPAMTLGENNRESSVHLKRLLKDKGFMESSGEFDNVGEEAGQTGRNGKPAFFFMVS